VIPGALPGNRENFLKRSGDRKRFLPAQASGTGFEKAILTNIHFAEEPPFQRMPPLPKKFANPVQGPNSRGTRTFQGAMTFYRKGYSLSEDVKREVDKTTCYFVTLRPFHRRIAVSRAEHGTGRGGMNDSGIQNTDQGHQTAPIFTKRQVPRRARARYFAVDTLVCLNSAKTDTRSQHTTAGEDFKEPYRTFKSRRSTNVDASTFGEGQHRINKR
jgi:hypothetical protein